MKQVLVLCLATAGIGCQLTETGSGLVNGVTRDKDGPLFLEYGQSVHFEPQICGGQAPYVIQVFGPEFGEGERLILATAEPGAIDFQPYLSGVYRVVFADARGNELEWRIWILLYASPHQDVFPPE